MNLGVANDRPSAVQPDWTREQRRGWEPSKALLKTIRDYQAVPRRSLAAKWAVLRHRFWSVVTGADIPLNSKIGGGLMLPHPNGVVIHPDAVIGPNCLLFQQVTIGDKQGGVPRLGGHVDVGAGAKLIGRIEIGDHAKIGAGAIVTIDVPEGATAVGNPARIVERKTICASSDEEARSIAISKFGAETISKWGIYREDGTGRIVVCRNLHALEGPETVEYLDQLHAEQAS
jgi:serine O-acetyltransferase